MITLKYRTKKNKTAQTKTFDTEEAYQAFTKDANIIVLEVERSGKAVAGRLNAIFGC